MSAYEMVILTGISVAFVFVWISLMRAGARRGGCGPTSCQLGTPDVDEKKDEANASNDR